VSRRGELHERPYQAFRTDAQGTQWHFAYWGSMAVYVRRPTEGPTPPFMVDGGEWPHLIIMDQRQVDAWDEQPEHITRGWFETYVRTWIQERNREVSA
jgi:hypothetical protein